MTLILQVFYSFFSGLILSIGIPNEQYLLGSPFIAFFSIIPYYLAIKNCKNYKQAFFCGVIQSGTTHLFSSFWLAYFKDFAIFTLGASALGTAFFGGSLALLMYLPFSRQERSFLNKYSLSTTFYEDPAFRTIFFASCYTFYEWVKSSGFLGYPWGTVSSAMYRWHSFTQIAAITGTYGLTFLTVLFDAIVAELFVRYFDCIHIHNKNHYFSSLGDLSITFAILFGLTLFYGSYQYSKTRTPIKTVTTVMVQQNCDPWGITDDEPTILNSQALSQKKIDELKKLDKKPQLLVWSEGSLIRPYPSASSYYRNIPYDLPLTEFIENNSVPLIVGGSYRKKIPPTPEEEQDPDYIPSYNYFNAAHIFDSEGNYRGFYGKLHLVPFAESIPGIDNPVIRKLFKKLVGISAGWKKGEQLVYVDVPCNYYGEAVLPSIQNIDLTVPYSLQKEQEKIPTVRISTPICFDDSFTDVIRPMFLNGTELFVNITDDSWSLKKSSEYQHFCVASFRAIEYRTTLVRSTNAGYSVVLDPAGKILIDQPLFEDSSVAFDVPVYSREITTYARFGNWLPYSCIAFTFLIAFLMYSNFTSYDYIPSERKKPLKIKKESSRKKKDKKKKNSKK